MSCSSSRRGGGGFQIGKVQHELRALEAASASQVCGHMCLGCPFQTSNSKVEAKRIERAEEL